MIEELKTLGYTTINGQQIRFYPSPLPGPDYPWHVLDDLMLSVDMPDWWRRTAVKKFSTAWPEHCRVMETASGPVVLCSSFCGRGFLDWMSEEGGRQVAAEREAFGEAVAFGFAKQMGHLTPREMEAACQLAATRWQEGAGSA